MQKFLDCFIKTFEDNNYSDGAVMAKEDSKNSFKLNYFPSSHLMQNLKNKNSWLNPMAILEVVESLLNIQKRNIVAIMDLYQK